MRTTWSSRRFVVSHPLAAARRGVGIVLGGALIATMTLAGTAGVASAASGGEVTDVITLTATTRVTPAQAGTSHFVTTSDTCTITSNGQQPVPCRFVGAGTVTPTGGQARGVVVSRHGVIIVGETFVFTSPTTTSGSGPTTRIQAGPPTTGTATADFVSYPTGDPNVLQQSGTITVRAS